MTDPGGPGAATVTPVPASARVHGVDVARGLALVFMASVHIVPSGTQGPMAVVDDLSGGRASALFAVLAGVSLSLVAGRTTPPAGRRLSQARWSLLGRAVVITVLGLTLGLMRSGVAVILVNYGALFVVACAFLGLRARSLAWVAVGWLLLSPVVGFWLRTPLPLGPGAVPSWESLVTEPVAFATELVLTGYYPVLQWTSYVLVGLAVGRSGLLTAGRRAVLALTLGGVAVAVGAKVLSHLLLDVAGHRADLVVPRGSVVSGVPLDEVLSSSMYGTTPTTSWWWLAVSGPHSASSLDLLHTTGTALAVLGACLLVVPVLQRATPSRLLVVPLASAGAMTLTLYCLHVMALAVAREVPPMAAWGLDPGRLWLGHVVVGLVLATLWRQGGRRLGLSGRGPVEALTTAAGQAAAAARTG